MGQGAVGGKVFDEDRKATEREPAAPEVRQVDAVEALEVGLQGVGLMADQRDERC